MGQIHGFLEKMLQNVTGPRLRKGSAYGVPENSGGIPGYWSQPETITIEFDQGLCRLR